MHYYYYAYLKEIHIHVHQKICTRMLKAALFVTAKEKKKGREGGKKKGREGGKKKESCFPNKSVCLILLFESARTVLQFFGKPCRRCIIYLKKLAQEFAEVNRGKLYA